jgi:hypothetical protein
VYICAICDSILHSCVLVKLVVFIISQEQSPCFNQCICVHLRHLWQHSSFVCISEISGLHYIARTIHIFIHWIRVHLRHLWQRSSFVCISEISGLHYIARTVHIFHSLHLCTSAPSAAAIFIRVH